MQDESELKTRSGAEKANEDAALYVKTLPTKGSHPTNSFNKQHFNRTNPTGHAYQNQYAGKATTSNNPQRRTKFCNYCKNKGHLINECRKKIWNDTLLRDHGSDQRKPDDKHGVAFMGATAWINDANWYADSGASTHMPKNKSLLYQYEEFDVPREITLGDKSVILAMGSGRIKFQSGSRRAKISEFVLLNVLYVPYLTVNLISISTAALEGIKVSFTDRECMFSYNGELVLDGVLKPESNLYKINIKAIETTTALFSQTDRTADN